MDKDIPKCPECGWQFKNVFEAVDHLIEDDDDLFDPALILPNGFSLMIGSLLRCLYGHAVKSEMDIIKEIVQSTYMTLYTAETNPELIGEMVQDIVINNEMADFDQGLQELLKADDESKG